MFRGQKEERSLLAWEREVNEEIQFIPEQGGSKPAERK